MCLRQVEIVNFLLYAIFFRLVVLVHFTGASHSGSSTLRKIRSTRSAWLRNEKQQMRAAEVIMVID
jgi:hypothetical protein